MISIKLNPLLAYSLRRQRIYFGRQLLLIVAAWTLTVVLMEVILTGESSRYDWLCLSDLLLLAYPFIMFAPMLTGLYSAMPNAVATQSANHDMILLTNITSADIMWSRIIIALFRLRWLLTLILSIGPAALFMVLVVLAYSNLASGGICTRTILNNVYCGSSALVSTDEVIVPSVPFFAVVWALALSMTGMNLLAAAIGALLEIYQRNRVVTFTVTVVLAFVLSLFVGLIMLNELMLKILVLHSLDIATLISLLLVAVLPYAATVELVRWSSRLVRRGG